MDGTNVNGGNADRAHENPNLETDNMPDLREIIKVETATIMDGQEVNGDIKSSLKKGRKRKLSEPDDSSEDSMGFNGFDLQENNEMEPASHVLKKLIAEAEVAETQLVKRLYEYSMRKSFNIKKDDDDSDDNRMHDTEHILDINKIKKEKESDKSETDSIGIPNTIESELEVQKTDEASLKSTNSSIISSPATSIKSKGTRLLRGTSPGSTGKQKIAVDMSNPAFKEPFKYGWKRELVFRASTDSSLKRMADIYYYTPKGKKVRSFREVAEFLNTKELTIDNFTFFKEPIGLDDPEKEIIRDAKRIRGSGVTPPRRGVGYKKGTPGRRAIIEEPAPVPTKTPAKSPKSMSVGFKVKVPAKKTPHINIKSPSQEREILPPQRTTSTRRSQLPSVEKPPPPKPKRLLTRKQNRQDIEPQQMFIKK